ncbi:MAG TPA: DUF6461 domain-containing protein [Nonomuraea sp.]|nr:DUF6461 domain-containing protein [Nonomuraea sp.]
MASKGDRAYAAKYALRVDGVVVAEFEPFFPGDQNGGDPDRLLAHMRELGMPLDGEAGTRK